MKKFFLLALSAIACSAQAEVITLNLTQLPETFTFDANGAWEQTYTGESVPFTIGEFTFAHYGHTGDSNVEGDYTTWEGWTIGNSPVKTYNDDYLTQQWNIVTGGGKAGVGTPYLFAYCSNYIVKNDIRFTTPRLPQELYFCQSAWTANCIEGKDSYASAFKEGDYCTVTIKGLDADGNEIEGKEVVYYLADYRSAYASAWTANKGWERCDLSALGTVSGLRFSFFTTDSDEWGFKTAQYFALDGLAVETVESGLHNTQLSQPAVRKVFENGQIYILRGNEKYTLQGVRVE